MKKYYLLRNANAQGIVDWMNENFKKENGKGFNRNDINAYIARGYVPKYLGDIDIEVIKKKCCTIRMYNVITFDSSLGGELDENQL